MTKAGLLMIAALLTCSTQGLAATCDFSKLPQGLDKMPRFSSGTNAVDAAKNYALNQPFSVKVGEPIIRRQIRTAANSVTFPQDVSYKPDWFLSPSYHLQGGRKYPVAQEIITGLSVLQFNDSTGAAYLFINKDGQLCDHVGSYYRSNNNWTLLHGNYAAQPDVAAVLANDIDPNTVNGIAIMLDSLDAVSVGLSIRHMQNGVYKDNIKQSFDNSMGVITVEGYQIRLNSLGNGVASFTVSSEPPPQ